jgi:3-ketosteroid 9alpha-monooxygenase subunit A
MAKRLTLPIPFGWYGIAFSDELAIGEVKPLHYFGQDIVLFRTRSGEARVLDAYCPHLGAHLGYGGSVVGETIACPFHGWQFNGEGFCEKVPYAKKIPTRADGQQCILTYPVVEKNKTIWCWYHPNQAAPLFEVDTVDEFYSDDWQQEFEYYDWLINASLQETSENGADSAHFKYVHHTENVPNAETQHQGHHRFVHIVAKAPAIDEDGNFDTTQFRDAITDVASCGPGMSVQKFSGSFDTVMLATATPVTDQYIHLRFAFTQLKQQNVGQEIMAKGLIGYIVSQVEQDIPIWEHKIYRPNPILCDGDGPINQFRIWFKQFYANNEIRSSKADQGTGGSLSKKELLTRISRRNPVGRGESPA